MKLFLLRLFTALFACVPAFAQVKAPKYANEFLAIGVGARALGMANTQVALTNDVTSAYWNPAGLLNIRNKYEVSLMHNELFAGGAQYDYAGFATPIDSVSHLAFSLVRFGTDNIANTLNLFDANGAIDYSRISFFSVADYAFFTSYARKMSWLPGLRVGGSVKVIYRNVGSFANGWGFGFDIGAQLERGKWKFGLTARKYYLLTPAGRQFLDELQTTWEELVASTQHITMKATNGSTVKNPDAVAPPGQSENKDLINSADDSNQNPDPSNQEIP